MSATTSPISGEPNYWGTGGHFAAELFPQHTRRSGVRAVLDAADKASAEVERLREENAGLRCRVEELTAERDDLRWQANR